MLEIMRRTLRLSLVLALIAGAALVAPTAAQAAYPGKDGLIAFVRNEQIYTIKSDGTALKQLTTSLKNDDPKWSPDGSRIAYVHELASGVRQIWTMSATGANQKQVTTLKYATEPAWSPDGKWIAFGGSNTIKDTGEATGAMMEKVKSTAPYGAPVKFVETDPESETPTVDRWLSWSSDGDHMLYYAHDYPDSPDDYVLELTISTGEVAEVADVGGSCCGLGDFADISLNAAGTHYGFADFSYQEGQPQPSKPLGSVAGVAPGSSYYFHGIRGDQAIAFAPAGDRLVLMNNAAGVDQIIITNPTFGHRVVVTTGYMPDWQPTH